jgi:multiple sugar transport system ATP-binding protein
MAMSFKIISKLFKKEDPEETSPKGQKEVSPSFEAEKKALAQKQKADRSADLKNEERDYRRRNALYLRVSAYQKIHSKEKKKAPEGVFLSAQHLNKIYANRVSAVTDFTLDIQEGEFLVLVGPSGCGKSTTLRMIAGLEDITSGDLFIDGQYANKQEPKDRGAALVFQSYALYPHMTVYENLAFGLSHLPKKEIEARIQAAAEMLQITEFLHRKPTQLSGGQCQRVALGRAVVRHAKVFLLDEPLSNLDAKLRVQMRSELVKLHGQLRNTMIYVTHDQTEAMTMADRIVVLNYGRIQQIGTPREVYDKPANLFVATFMGSPTMNILPAHYGNGLLTFGDRFTLKLSASQIALRDAFYAQESKRLAQRIEFDRHKLALTHQELGKEEPRDYQKDLEEATQELEEASAAETTQSQDLFFGLRPEDMAFEKDGVQGIPATIEVSELLGSEYSLHFHQSQQEVVARVPSSVPLKSGEKGTLSFDLRRCHLFDKASKRIIF